MILQCSHVSKTFIADPILSDISFFINEHEKAAIVGPNGCGKSTLLKIITGHLSADDGEIILSKDTSVGYLAQNQEYDSDHSILEEMQDAKKEVIDLEKKMNALSAQMNELSGDALDEVIAKFDNTRHRFEQLNGYAYQSEITGVLKGLGFTEEEFSKKVMTLSGGQKTRVALGKMLLLSPDLIILDEPTNHLDMASIHWLETYLSNYSGAVLIVAHDRYFLDKIVSKVIEIDHTKCTVYQGNYSQYSVKRQARLEAQMRQYVNQQAAIKHQEEVITKLRSFNREKSIKRAESREKMLDKMEKIDKPTEENTKMKLRFTPKIQSGNDVLTIKHLSKGFDDATLFSDLNFEVKRGDRVAIIGDNGSGKTTILKMINHLLEPDEGEIILGTNVEIGYYDQEHHVLHPEKTLFDELQDTYPHMNNTAIRNILAAFLFTDDDVFKQVKSLSGGEKGRVSLAKLMLSDANFLILDEPTNHLDMDSKEILEDALNHFEGTVLYVSHDRYFINQTATRILDLTQNQLVQYIGNYDYYLEKKDDSERAQINPNAAVSNNDESNATNSSSENALSGTDSANAAGKMDWQQQKEAQKEERKRKNALKKIEDEIEKLETRNEEIGQELSDPANGTNLAKLQELSKEQQANDTRLEELMEQWEQLEV